jgi:hypothetical protein
MADTRDMTLLERESSLASLAEYAREACRGEGRATDAAEPGPDLDGHGRDGLEYVHA